VRDERVRWQKCHAREGSWSLIAQTRFRYDSMPALCRWPWQNDFASGTGQHRVWRSGGQTSFLSGVLKRQAARSRHYVPLLIEVVDQGDGPMLERADSHQRIDLDAGNRQFGALGCAFRAVPIKPLDHSTAYPLNAKFIRRHINIYSKTTVFDCHKTLQTRQTGRSLDTPRGEPSRNASTPLRTLQRAGQASNTNDRSNGRKSRPVFPLAFMRRRAPRYFRLPTSAVCLAACAGIAYSHSAMTSPSSSSAHAMETTPCQPRRLQNTPPSEPMTLDPM
jgi:hypothetical protein